MSTYRFNMSSDDFCLFRPLPKKTEEEEGDDSPSTQKKTSKLSATSTTLNKRIGKGVAKRNKPR